jgi:hypothetical protein
VAQISPVEAAPSVKRRRSAIDPVKMSPSSSIKGKERAIDLDDEHGDPSTKRRKDMEEEGEDDHCAICLSPILDRTTITPCRHSLFCFKCLRAWTEQSRKCPLCLGTIHNLVHKIRSLVLSANVLFYLR